MVNAFSKIGRKEGIKNEEAFLNNNLMVYKTSTAKGTGKRKNGITRLRL
jgi:hypothetical protein